MARCDCCGNEYEHAFSIEKAGQRYTFDSLQCAIRMVAPVCQSCGCHVIGHGVDKAGRTYCSNHCAA